MKKRARGRERIIKSRDQLRTILNFKKQHKLSDTDLAAHYGFSVNTIYNTINYYKKLVAKKRKASAKRGVNLSKQQSGETS